MPKPFAIAPERKKALKRLGNAQFQYESQSGRHHVLAIGYTDAGGTFITHPFCDSTGRYDLDIPEDLEAFNKSGFLAMPVELLERMAAHIEDALSISEDMSSEQISRVHAHIGNAVELTRELNGEGPA